MSYDSDAESRDAGTPRESNGRSDTLTSAEKGTTARGVLSLNVTVGLAVALAAAVFCHSFTLRFFPTYSGWSASFYALLIGADVFAAVVLVRSLEMDPKRSRLRNLIAWCAGLPAVDLACLIPAFFHAASSARRALNALDAAGTGTVTGKKFRFAFLHAWLIGMTLALFAVGVFLMPVLFHEPVFFRDPRKNFPLVELIPLVFSGRRFLELLSCPERLNAANGYLLALNFLFYAFLFLRAAFVWRLADALRCCLRTKSAANGPAVGHNPPRPDAQ